MALYVKAPRLEDHGSRSGDQVVGSVVLDGNSLTDETGFDKIRSRRHPFGFRPGSHLPTRRMAVRTRPTDARCRESVPPSPFSSAECSCRPQDTELKMTTP